VRPVPEIRDVSSDGRVRLEAWLDGVRVGEATARPIELFEHEQFCHVEVDEAHRRAGFGAALYAALDARVPDTEALITRVLHADTAAAAFVDAVGHAVIEHCPAPRAVPTDDAWRAWAAVQPPPPGADVVRSDAVPAEQLDEAFTDWYVWAHTMIGPLRPREVVAAAVAGIAGELDHDVSRLVVREGRVAALSLVSAESWDGVPRILAEATRLDEPDGTPLVAAAVAASLQAFDRRGDALVELEGRTIDPHLSAVVATFPPHDAAPLSVVRLRRRDRAQSTW
jgi:hypothetical protein